MSVFVIFACEVVTFSFLIGTFGSSSILGLSVCGLSGLIMYALYQKFYNSLPFIWGIALLAGTNSLLWASYIDALFDTTFIALTLGIITAVFFYGLNKRLFKMFHE